MPCQGEIPILPSFATGTLDALLAAEPPAFSPRPASAWPRDRPRPPARRIVLAPGSAPPPHLFGALEGGLTPNHFGAGGSFRFLVLVGALACGALAVSWRTGMLGTGLARDAWPGRLPAVDSAAGGRVSRWRSPAAGARSSGTAGWSPARRWPHGPARMARRWSSTGRCPAPGASAAMIAEALANRLTNLPGLSLEVKRTEERRRTDGGPGRGRGPGNRRRPGPQRRRHAAWPPRARRSSPRARSPWRSRVRTVRSSSRGTCPSGPRAARPRHRVHAQGASSCRPTIVGRRIPTDRHSSVHSRFLVPISRRVIVIPGARELAPCPRPVRPARDRAGRVYTPAVGPRLRPLLWVILVGFALLAANGVLPRPASPR